MNDAIRTAIGSKLVEKNMSRADLARAIEKTPQEVTRALNGTKGGGSVPALWQAMLDEVGLTLVAVPKPVNEGEHVDTAPKKVASPEAIRATLEQFENLAAQLKQTLAAIESQSEEDPPES